MGTGSVGRGCSAQSTMADGKGEADMVEMPLKQKETEIPWHLPSAPLKPSVSASHGQTELRLAGVGGWEREFCVSQLPNQGPAGWGVDNTILQHLLSLFSIPATF